MTDLFIEPSDVLLFRDGRAFTAGDNHIARGLFPPLPTTFYGALRSAMLNGGGVDFFDTHFGLDETSVLRQEAGTKDVKGSLEIRHFSLAAVERAGAGQETWPPRRLFPMPYDVLRPKEGNQGDELPLLLRPPAPSAPERPGMAGVQTNLPGGVQLLWHQHSETKLHESPDGLLCEKAFAGYLEGKPPRLPAPYSTDQTAAAQHFSGEPRTSVQVKDKTQAVDEGKLFTVEFTRLNHHDRRTGFALRLANASSLPGPAGLLRLAGEARAASYEPFEMPPLGGDGFRQRLQEQVTDAGRFKLVLTTPAVLDDGWCASAWLGNEAQLGGCAVTLVAAAVGRYQVLGGWDLAAGRPKLTRRAVPAGSVYFFTLNDARAAGDLFDACFGHSICRTEGGALNDDGKQGLGLAYIGVW